MKKKMKVVDTEPNFIIAVNGDDGRIDHSYPVRLETHFGMPRIREHVEGVARDRDWHPCSPTLDDLNVGEATWRMCRNGEYVATITVYKIISQ